MSNCIFCKIINKEIPAEIIYENDFVIAFNDINPKAPIHILIVPKKHIATIDDVTEADKNMINELIFAAQKIAREKNISQDGYRLVFNIKNHGGQEVEHIHLHLLGGTKLGNMV